MSNPLLRPNDSRFQKPEVRDAAGQNRFAEGGEAGESSAPAADVYSVSVADEARPFQPKYEVQQAPRWGMLLLLAVFGALGGLLGTVSLTGFFISGWICPLLGVGPAGAAALLGYEDLKAIEAGAIDSRARASTRLATWLGFAALLACLAIVASMIYQNMKFLPDLF